MLREEVILETLCLFNKKNVCVAALCRWHTSLYGSIRTGSDRSLHASGELPANWLVISWGGHKGLSLLRRCLFPALDLDLCACKTHFNTLQRERRCVCICVCTQSLVKYYVKLPTDTSKGASQSIQCYGNVLHQIWFSRKVCEGRARIRLYSKLSLDIKRPWTITWIREPFSWDFSFPQVFLHLDTLLTEISWRGIWAQGPDCRTNTQPWPGRVRYLAKISCYHIWPGIWLEHIKNQHSLRNGTGFLSVEIYEANRKCVGVPASPKSAA